VPDAPPDADHSYLGPAYHALPGRASDVVGLAVYVVAFPAAVAVVYVLGVVLLAQ
jgi:hypothetical protein